MTSLASQLRDGGDTTRNRTCPLCGETIVNVRLPDHLVGHE